MGRSRWKFHMKYVRFGRRLIWKSNSCRFVGHILLASLTCLGNRRNITEMVCFIDMTLEEIHLNWQICFLCLILQDGLHIMLKVSMIILLPFSIVIRMDAYANRFLSMQLDWDVSRGYRNRAVAYNGLISTV